MSQRTSHPSNRTGSERTSLGVHQATSRRVDQATSPDVHQTASRGVIQVTSPVLCYRLRTVWLAQRRRRRRKGATADHRVMALAEHHRTQHTGEMPGVITFNTGGLAQCRSHLQAPTKHRKAHSNATKVGHDALRFMFYAGPVHYTDS